MLIRLISIGILVFRTALKAAARTVLTLLNTIGMLIIVK